MPPLRRALLLLTRWIPGWILGTCAALLLLWPCWLWPGWALPGHEGLDLWSHAWGMRWFVDSLLHLEPPWQVDGVAFPEERVLWYIDPLGALLTAPLQLLGGPALAYNYLLFFQVAWAGAAGWAMGRALGGRGWLAGAALATLPYLQGEIWNGVAEACWIGWVPLAALCAARGSRWTGLAVGLAGVATPYHGLSAALIASALLLGRRESADRRLRALLRMALLAGLCALPHYLLIRESMNSPLAFVNRALSQVYNWPVLTTNAVDPRAFIMPGDFWSRATDPGPLSAAWRRTPYLGLCLLALAPLGIWRRPRLAVLLLPIAIALVLALGPFLWWGGQFLRDAQGSYYRLPMAFVLETLQLALHHHMRFAVGAIVGLAALADKGAGRWALLLVPLVVWEHLSFGPNSWPMYLSPAALPPVYEAIPDNGRAIIDLPGDSGVADRTNRYLYYQAWHGHPIPYVNKAGGMSTASDNAALKTMVQLGLPEPPRPGAPGVPAADADIPAALAQLSEQGFGYVVLHRDLCLRDGYQRHRELLDELLGPPRKVGQAEWWTIPSAAPR